MKQYKLKTINVYGNAASIYATNGASAEWFLSPFSSGMLGKFFF
jgi:hypothetical protein